ncbi:MAG: hypothetical protein COA86_15340 [Kangiella sp.]|nr:MAG: hypothetical protein COA86_15340 [Kangiella sp.]
MTANEHWSNYWLTSQVSACGDGMLYDDQLGIKWKHFFSQVKSPFRLLDLGTGNGYIARLAADEAEKKCIEFHITGIEYADLSFKELIAYINSKGGEFKGHALTDMSSISFLEDKYDIVTSQFSFEYSDWKETINAIDDKLNVDGILVLAIHIKTGAYYQGATHEIMLAEYFLNKVNLIKFVRNTIIENKLTLNSVSNEILQEKIDHMISVGQSYFRRIKLDLNLNSYPNFITNIFEVTSSIILNLRNIDESFVILKLDELEASLNFHTERLNNLIDGAFSIENIETLKAELRTKGFNNIIVEEVRREIDQNAISWFVQAKK